jgi:hypothetical protein
MKVGDKVYYFEIKLDFKNDCVNQSKQEFNVAGVNEEYVCIDNYNFTSIQLKKRYSSDKEKELFNNANAWEMRFSTYWDYIQGFLYTTCSSEKVAYKKVKKALEEFIFEKHGRYCNAISFLDKIKI